MRHPVIDGYVRKYRRRRQARKSILTQKATPSWAKAKQSSSAVKRPYPGDNVASSSKRPRDDDSDY